MIVTKMRRADHGELEARVSIDGSTVDVTRRYGSWHVPANRRRGTKEQVVLKPYAEVLQEKARAFERREQKEVVGVAI